MACDSFGLWNFDCFASTPTGETLLCLKQITLKYPNLFSLSALILYFVNSQLYKSSISAERENRFGYFNVICFKQSSVSPVGVDAKQSKFHRPKESQAIRLRKRLFIFKVYNNTSHSTIVSRTTDSQNERQTVLEDNSFITNITER